MSRVVWGMTAGAMLAILAGPASAADWGGSYKPTLRPAYPADLEQPDPLTFEGGIRYFYGMGSQSGTSTVGGREVGHEASDQSHFVEIHGRINDASTSSFLKGNLGIAAAIDGTFETTAYDPAFNASGSTDSGNIAYAGADFGYTPFGTESFQFGGLVGYRYNNESVDVGRANYVTASGGGDSDPNNFEIHSLRLGVTARADINDMFDFQVDAAAIPYAYLTGTYGSLDVDGLAGFDQGSAATVTGNLYGGSVEAMAGFRPTDNLVIRAGARAYYLTGPTETYFEVRDPSDDSAQGVISEGNFEFWRWGPVLEITGTF